jgi:hypothetical protein
VTSQHFGDAELRCHETTCGPNGEDLRPDWPPQLASAHIRSWRSDETLGDAAASAAASRRSS